MCPIDGQSSDTDDTDDDGRSANDQLPSAVVDPQAEMCEVCLIKPRDAMWAPALLRVVRHADRAASQMLRMPQQHQSGFASLVTNDTLHVLFGQSICNLLLWFDFDPSPRSSFQRGGYHLIDRFGSGRYAQKTNPAQWKASFPSAVSEPYRAEDCRQN